MTLKASIIGIYILLGLQVILVVGSPIKLSEDEQNDKANAEINAYIKRFEKFSWEVDPRFKDDLQKLTLQFQNALDNMNVEQKSELLELNLDGFGDEFKEYMDLKIKKQKEKEAFLFEKWYYREWLRENETAKEETESIKSGLAKLQKAIRTQSFDEDDPFFTDILDSYWNEISDISDDDFIPEPFVTVIVKMFRKYLHYLLGENSFAKFSKDLEKILEKTEAALSPKGTEAVRRELVYQYDRNDTKIGRYLMNHLDEFVLDELDV